MPNAVMNQAKEKMEKAIGAYTRELLQSVQDAQMLHC